MTENQLTALRRHFEEEYGRLDVGVRRKKRKQSHVEVESAKNIVSESDEEWHGIEYSQSTAEPQVISFTETAELTEDETTTYKGFMVHFLVYKTLNLVLENAQGSKCPETGSTSGKGFLRRRRSSKSST